MPHPAHTPASRRFLPPSSSSRSYVNSSSSTHRPAFVTSPHPSTSPFVKTPYTQHQRGKDDIEGEFDDHEDSSPTNGARQAALLHDDTIEDTVDHNPFPPGKDVDSDTGDLDELHTANQFSSPLPKRQKLAHQPYHNKEHNEISSPLTDRTDTNKITIDDNEESDMISSADEGHTKRSRFQSSSNHPLSQTPARTGFRSLFQSISTGDNTHLNSPLPDTFSPSRKKGKKEYIHGGAAEAARGWILEIANEQTREETKLKHEVILKSAIKDNSGRFEIAEDEQQGPWMMVYQDGRPPSHVIQQKVVNIRGSKTAWELQLNDKEKLNVAVLWDRV